MKNIARLIRARVPAPAWRTMKGGYQMRLRPASDPYEHSMYVAGCYEPATLALMDQVLNPGGVMVDVGANLGLMTLHGAKRVGPEGTVVAVEPHPIYAERLRRNIERNGFRNIRVVEAAAGSAIGKSKIFDVPDVNIGCSSLIDPGHGVEAGVAEVRTLDDVLGGLRPDFLKIDVEGFEPEVLKGAQQALQARPVICMELVTSQPAFGGDHLEAHNIVMGTGLYDCFRFALTKFGASSEVVPFEPTGVASFHDNLIYKPKS